MFLYILFKITDSTQSLSLKQFGIDYIWKFTARIFSITYRP